METTKNILAITGGITIGALVLKSIADKIISNVEITNGIPQIDNTPFLNGDFRVNIPVIIKNRNPFPLGVDALNGVIKYGQITLSKIAIPYGFSVDANSESVFNLDMDIPIQTVFQDVAALINGGNIFNALLNKITLTDGEVSLFSNYVHVRIPLREIPIPIV